MADIKLLDCTLRDGGYVNEWEFGEAIIQDVLDKMLKTGVDIIEVGFIRDVEYNSNKAVFPNISTLDKMMDSNNIAKGSSKLALMAEIDRPIPLEKIEPASQTGVDIIRVIVWKSKHTPDGKVVDALQESYEYCKGIVEKGYQLCIQPNRTDQYSDEEFVNMLRLFEKLNPYALYVVDSWGTMYSNQILHYMEIADRILSGSIAIGFHGHNNLMQAFSTAEKIIERNYEREIILDASIVGIGRGAGNLNLELVARYLNHVKGYNYCLEPMYEVYDLYIKKMEEIYKWGSTPAYMISAIHNANPNYASDYSTCLTLHQMDCAYRSMKGDEKILYSKERANQYQLIAKINEE